MLHLRVISPSSHTESVMAVLGDEPAVSALGILRDASVLPVGDIVLADVAREAASDVLERLRDTGVHESGAIHIDPVAAWISRPAFEAERSTSGSSADAVVWPEVVQHAYEESELNWTYLSFMTLATLLAAIAIVLDSQILVIGAMVLGPEFVAIAALGLALVRRRPHLLRRAARTVVLGFAIAILLTMLASLAARAFGWVTVADVTAPRPETAFIYSPDRWSFIVALIAAAAGVLSLTSAKAGGISGVFISVTTVPAAGNVGLGLAFGSWGEVGGSALTLLINITGMALAGWATLAFQQLVWARASARRARLIERLRKGPGPEPLYPA